MMKYSIAFDTKMFKRALVILSQEHISCKDDLDKEKQK